MVNKLIKDRLKNCQKHYLKKLKEIYNTGKSTDGGYDELTGNKIINSDQLIVLRDIIQMKNKLEIIREVTGTDRAILINSKTKKVVNEQTYVVNKKNLSKYTTVIEAYPKEVIVYDSPLTDEPRTFEIKWDSKLSNRIITTGGEIGGGSVSEIESQLNEAAYCPNPRYLKGSVSSVISAYIKNNLATIKKEVEYPGFFYDNADKELLAIKYNLVKPNPKDLKLAVSILEDLVKHFKGSEDKLATCLKWGWLSPFSYVKKQKGEFLPWLVMDGVAGTGKSVLGTIILLLWGEPSEDNDIAGASFDTVARVGSRISQSTFPIIINEPIGTFQNEAVVDMLKSAIERTTARGKYMGNRYKYIPSLASLVFTTNKALPNLDAIARRIHKITFSFSERKDKKAKKNFESEFDINQPKISSLNHLKYISNFFANEILNNPKMINDDWKDCANGILQRLYADIDYDMPEWLVGYVKNTTLEEFDEDQKEDIRMFLIDQINKHKNSIKIFNEKGYEEKDESLYSEELKNSTDFKDRVWNVINERLIPWIILIDTKGKKYVCFTQGFKKELHNETEVCQSLQSISELLGWKYQAVRLNKGDNPRKVIKISLDKFISFLYPDVEMKFIEES